MRSDFSTHTKVALVRGKFRPSTFYKEICQFFILDRFFIFFTFYLFFTKFYIYLCFCNIFLGFFLSSSFVNIVFNNPYWVEWTNCQFCIFKTDKLELKQTFFSTKTPLTNIKLCHTFKLNIWQSLSGTLFTGWAHPASVQKSLNGATGAGAVWQSSYWLFGENNLNICCLLKVLRA